MITRNETGAKLALATPTKRTRLDGLLFDGSRLGATALTVSALAGPKLPPHFGE